MEYLDPTIRERTDAGCVKAHPNLDKSKDGRWSDNDFSIWPADGIAGSKLGEGARKGKTIVSSGG